MTARIVRKIGMNLRALRPFWIGIWHCLVCVAMELLGTLCLHVGVSTRRVPDAAEVRTLLDDGHLVAVPGKRLCCRQSRYAGADHANLFWAHHVILLCLARTALSDRALSKSCGLPVRKN